MRRVRDVKDFCEAVRVGKQFRIPEKEREDWMPAGRAADELFCYQVNARKVGARDREPTVAFKCHYHRI